ncbi:hypothetical protein SUNI508_05904 [Seiridium unicorne]|uniref:Uncharacterized protein n=1 Tax=Seiridium unicorne TaxID=138068 RepID=A0ABR2V3E7_9PEZI
MNWWAILMVALAAPVWSHNHNQRHKHRRQNCEGTFTTTVTSYVTAGVGTVQTSSELQATPAVEVVQTSQEVQTTTSKAVETSTTSAVQTTTTSAIQTAATYAVQTTTADAVQTSQPTASAGSTIKTPSRATWLWQSDIIKDSAEVEQFLSFAESNGIKSVYTLIDRDMGQAVFETFIEQCNASGIAVEALMGNSEWILGQGDPTLESQLTWLEQYQGNASASSQFAGIHMDVEPWGLDGWESNAETYTSALQSIVTQITALGQALGLPVAADLPYWADTITCPITGKTFDSWMLDNLDTATFMTYRNTASELLDIATAVLEAGNTAGKPVWLAVETVDAADALLISYYGKSATTLFNDLVAVNATAATYASFAGIAIHDYDGILALG